MMIVPLKSLRDFLCESTITSFELTNVFAVILISYKAAKLAQNEEEFMANQEIPRPNEHRAWFVDATVIDFLWKKGWNCCKAEACDWWHDINERLKKEFFVSEQEWKKFKENGVYPAKHQTNWAKLTLEEKNHVEKLCWNSKQSCWAQEQLMAYTLAKLKEKKRKHE